MILVLAYHYGVHNDMSEVKSGKVCILRYIDDVVERVVMCSVQKPSTKFFPHILFNLTLTMNKRCNLVTRNNGQDESSI